MANNPKLHRAPAGSTADGLRRGVQPGEGAVREARPAGTRVPAAHPSATVPARCCHMCLTPRVCTLVPVSDINCQKTRTRRMVQHAPA
jgi:hypothetical protein